MMSGEELRFAPNTQKKLNILVAIDEVPDALWDRFKTQSQISFVRDGRAAYRALRAEQFDVVFLDLNLTGFDGLELLRRTKAEELCRTVILTSETPSFYYAQQGILYGVAAYLLRPLNSEEVSAVVRKFMSAASAHDQQLLHAVHTTAGCLRETDAAKVFLRTGEELAAVYGTAVERAIRWRDYYEALIAFVYECWPWLRLYDHPNQYSALDYIHESDDQMIVNFCSRKVQYLNDSLRELFPLPNNRKLDEILILLLRSIDKNMQQKEVADRYFITNATLSSRFQRNLNISYREYMTILKLRRGQYLLRYTDTEPDDLAHLLGYKDKEYFAKIFRQHTGQTIREYGSKYWSEYNI